MKTTEAHQVSETPSEEIRRISIVSILALLLFILSVILDGPVTVLAWFLTAAGLLCLIYIVLASRILLNQKHSSSPKANTQ